nr:PQQ-binding-like beta-propeller repeat protein [Desulforamulus aquiferis]
MGNDLLWLSDGVYALEPGKNFKWRYSDEKNVVAILGDKENVYVCTGDKKSGYILRALDHTGSRIWYRNLDDLKNIEMTIGPDGNLYIITNPANLDRNSSAKAMAINATNGKEIWSYAVKTNDLTKVSFSGEGTLFFTGKNQIHSIDLKTGSLNWELPLLNVVSGVAIDDQKRRIYAGSSDGRLFCVSFNGRMLWDKIPDSSPPPTLHKDGE